MPSMISMGESGILAKLAKKGEAKIKNDSAIRT